MRIAILLLVLVIFIAGCVKQPYSSDKETELIQQLKDMEKQLENESTEAEVKDQNVAIGSDNNQVQKIEVSETELISLNVAAEDADQDTLTYTFTSPLDSTGKWQTNYGDAGEYMVTITASDGTNKVTNDVLLTVNKKNVAPVISELPSRLEVKEGDKVELKPVITDANKDEFEVKFSAPLESDGTWETDHTSAGEYDVIVSASDGEAEAKINMVLVVQNVNMPPEIKGIEEVMFVNEGETVTIKPEVSDLDNDNVEVSISEPIGDDGVWETSFTSNGEYIISVTASDGKDTISKQIMLTVKDVNVPPKIISITQG